MDCDLDEGEDEDAVDISQPDNNHTIPEPEPTIDLGNADLPHNDFIDEEPSQTDYIGELIEDQEPNDIESASPAIMRDSILDNRCKSGSVWDVDHTISNLRGIAKFVKNHYQKRIMYENLMENYKVSQEGCSFKLSYEMEFNI